MTRRNLKRTGGPKSVAGKQLVAGNAMKMGVYSLTAIVLPGEDENAFHELHEQFIHDFVPRDVAEASMVHDLAVLTWKKMRLDRIEHTAMMRELNGPFTRYEFAHHPKLHEKIADRVREMGADVETHRQAFFKAHELLDDGVSSKDLPVLKKQFPLIFQAVTDWAEMEFTQPFPPEEWDEATVSMQSGQEMPFLRYALAKFLADYQGLDWAFEHLERVQADIRAALEVRLLSFMDNRVKRRARDDLERSFYRTLAELRRHQGWRRTMSEITVNPESKPEVLKKSPA